MPADDTSAPRVFGIIPAAGESARMGRPKQLLPYGSSTVLQTVIETMLAAQLDGVVVVTDQATADALHLADDKRHMTFVPRPRPSEMLASVVAGIDRAATRHMLKPRDAFCVCPGDMPTLPPGLIEACARDYRAHPGHIVVGAANGVPGHPLVAPLGLRGELDKLHGVGLKGILGVFPDKVRLLDTSAPGAQRDMDTPSDYQALSGKPLNHTPDE